MLQRRVAGAVGAADVRRSRVLLSEPRVQRTGERVDDAQCNNSSTDGRSSGIYAWYFYSRGASVPAIGQNRSTSPGYSRTIPSGAKASTGYSSKGGTVSRGGFGSSAKSGTSGGGKVSGG